jgi:Cytochrome b(C-terminal)/b6/petD
MHHEDLTPSVLAGLAWYYLLAALMNAAAAAYLAYGEMVSEGASRVGLAPKTRRFPGWVVGGFFGLYALGSAIILLRDYLPGGVTAAYCLFALANAVLAVIAGADAAHFAEVRAHGHGEGDPTLPPNLDDHQPAVGMGGPVNRTLWALIWGVGAVIFQAMGITYAMGGSISLPLFMRNMIDYVAGPTTFFVGATLGFMAVLRWRRFVTNGLVGWSIVNLFLLIFGLSMTDYDFRDIVTKPDNVPIVGLLILVGCFFWYGLRRAVINDNRIGQGLPALEELEPEKTLTWPDLVYTELICMVVLTIVLVAWGIVLQAPLEQPASSTVAPNPSKAPWYFLGLQEMLVYFDPWMAGVVLPSMIIVGLIAIPYIDTNKAGNGYYTVNDRKFAYVTFQYGFVVLWVVLILLGTFLRGPNWNFFGPYQFWDLHMVLPLNNVNLSDLIWIQIIGTAKPPNTSVANILLRESPGILLTIAYFTVTPYLMYLLFFKEYVKQAGWVRYLTLAMLLLFMASLPIKMVLRWTMNLKYVVAIPEYFFNI